MKRRVLMFESSLHTPVKGCPSSLRIEGTGTTNIIDVNHHPSAPLQRLLRMNHRRSILVFDIPMLPGHNLHVATLEPRLWERHSPILCTIIMMVHGFYCCSRGSLRAPRKRLLTSRLPHTPLELSTHATSIFMGSRHTKVFKVHQANTQGSTVLRFPSQTGTSTINDEEKTGGGTRLKKRFPYPSSNNTMRRTSYWEPVDCSICETRGDEHVIPRA